MNIFTKYFICIVTFLFLLGLKIDAQKPVPTRDFETKIEYEEASVQIENSRVSTESGYPLAIYNPGFPLNPDTPSNMALQYLNANKSLLGLTDSDIQNLQLHTVREGPSGITVRFRQYLNGLAVNKAELTISINTKNVVSFLTNSFKYNVELDDFEPALSAEDARQKVYEKLNFPENHTEAQNELMIFHHKGTTKLIYQIILISEDPLGEWEAFVDAENGEILKLEDIAFYYHEHHEAVKPGLPPADFQLFMLINGTGNVFDPDPLSSANAGYGDPGFSDNGDNTSTQLDAELVSKTLLDITFDGTNYHLDGPWAEIKDFELPLYGLFSQSSSDWNFDRQDNAFEATNTYYHIDASMRYVNIDLGLTIKPDLYPGGVRYDPHALNGADNSYYSGTYQRLAFGEGGVDDAEDSDVIHHELGHGLHDWVTGGSLSQVEGLSEGCGDYWAASYNRFLGDWDPADAQYNWVFNWDGHNPFWNGRVVNYGATYPDGLTGFIHTDGQIWATCMMNVWDEIGRTQTDKAFWEGLGDTNSSTNQNDAANAVYQAAIDMSYSNSELTAMHEQMTNTGYILPDVPLPVELSSFSGIKEGKTVHLFWTTLSETENDYFTLERSSDGSRFEILAIIDAFGNSLETLRYDFIDNAPVLGINYYRLKQTDLDGKYAYSKVISVDFETQKNISIYPNPATQTLFIQSEILKKPNTQIAIFDFSGNEVRAISTNQLNSKTISIEIGQLPAGIYSLKIQSGENIRLTSFLKN